jgi:hypothetical protein
VTTEHNAGPLHYAKALFLAAELEASKWLIDQQEAADELRRQHEVIAELLEALKLARSIIGHPEDAHSKLISAAIDKAEGVKP